VTSQARPIKEVLDHVWDKHDIADPLRRCRWQRFGDYVKTTHSHYRPAPIKVRQSRTRGKTNG